jgi:hypothetical protein
MRCPQCQTEIAADALFCHKCGNRLDTLDPPAENPQSGDTPLTKFKDAAAARMDVADEPESELWRGGYSSRAMAGAWAASAAIALVVLSVAILWAHGTVFWLLFVAAFLPGLYSLAVLIYRRMSVHYLLTNQRFIHESGFLRRITNRIEVLDMDDISFEQTLIERMLGVGTIRILSSDRSTPDLLLKGIENVAEISNLLDNTRRAERRRRGLHIENI